MVRVFDRLTVFCDEWQKTATAPNGHREDMKTVNEILAATKVLDQVNMHELNAYLDESKIIRKVAGYAEKAAKDEAGAGQRFLSKYLLGGADPLQVQGSRPELHRIGRLFSTHSTGYKASCSPSPMPTTTDGFLSALRKPKGVHRPSR